MLPLALVHTLGNLLTNVSLGHVAVSFTHTIKVNSPFQFLLLGVCGTASSSLTSLYMKCAQTALPDGRLVPCSAETMDAEWSNDNYLGSLINLQSIAKSRTLVFWWGEHSPSHCHVRKMSKTMLSGLCNLQAMEPFFSVLLSALFLGESPTVPVVLSLLPVVGGVALASASEVTFNWPGFLAAMGSNVTFQSRNVFSKKFMGKKKVPPFLF